MNKFGFLKGFSPRLAFDTFTRANGELGTAESGQTWVRDTGTLRVISNTAGATATGNHVSHINVSSANVAVSADVYLITSDTSVGIVARVLNSSNYMYLRAQGTGISIRRVVGDTFTTLATYAYTWSGGTVHALKFVCSGDNFYGYLDGTLVITATNVNALAANTGCGLVLAQTDGVNPPNSRYDNFVVDAA